MTELEKEQALEIRRLQAKLNNKDENYYLIYEYVGKVEVQEFDDILSLESYINFMQIENYNIIKGVMIHEGSKED